MPYYRPLNKDWAVIGGDISTPPGAVMPMAGHRISIARRLPLREGDEVTGGLVGQA
jgi:hypothetical protein